MLRKIDLRDVVRDHFRTLVRYPDTRTSPADIVLFVLLPLALAAGAAALHILLSPVAVDVLTNAMAILAGLLFNLLVLIHSLARGYQGPTGTADAQNLLQQVYANIAYSILLALLALVPLVFVASAPDARRLAIVASSVALFLVIHFTLTLLMVLKRVHALLSFDFRSHP